MLESLGEGKVHYSTEYRPPTGPYRPLQAPILAQLPLNQPFKRGYTLALDLVPGLVAGST